MTVDDRLFGKTSKGEKIFAFEISNSSGISMTVITYGATLQSFIMPDKSGNREELTLGFDSIEGYESEHPYFGSTVGRVAGRISGGRFTIEGREYRLALNDGENSLHGGFEGFSRKIWDAYPFVSGKTAGVKLFLESPDGDQGYPGTLKVNLAISLDEENNLEFSYKAETSKSTIVNLTNHAYWNLNGAGKGKIVDHILSARASGYPELDKALAPTGKIIPSAGSPVDFTLPKRIGDDIPPSGYDHYLILDKNKDSFSPDITLYSGESGRKIEMTTDCPGVQFYTGNFLDGFSDRNGNLHKQDALCLEPGEYPDAVNHSSMPDTVLSPGSVYSRNTVMKFSVQ